MLFCSNFAMERAPGKQFIFLTKTRTADLERAQALTNKPEATEASLQK